MYLVVIPLSLSAFLHHFLLSQLILVAKKTLADLLLELSTGNIRHFDENFAGAMAHISLSCTCKYVCYPIESWLLLCFTVKLVDKDSLKDTPDAVHPLYPNDPYEVHPGGGLHSEDSTMDAQMRSSGNLASSSH
jgi:hypothetical protein